MIALLFSMRCTISALLRPNVPGNANASTTTVASAQNAAVIITLKPNVSGKL